MKAFIHLYAALIQFRTEQDPDKADLLANELIVLLQSHQHTIPETLLEEFEIQIRNHWTSRYQQTRHEKYPLLQHQLQLQQIERLRHNNKGIPASQLANISFTALKIHKVQWAEEVLSWLGLRIMDAKAELIYPILITHLLFEQKRHAEAARTLPHYITYGELKDMDFYTIAAKLDIKIRYEMNCLLEEEHFNMFRATQAQVKRDRSMAPARREQRILFFPLALKLYRAKDYLGQNPKANVAKRLQEVREALHTGPVVDADWLQAKLAEFGQPDGSAPLKTENK